MATKEQLYKFLTSMGLEEVTYFYDTLPESIDDWFGGGFGDNSLTKHLPIHFASTVQAKGTKYSSMDAMAVALGHLKKIYPPKLQGPIYRSLLIKSKVGLPNAPKILWRTEKKRKPMTSWTYDKNIKVEGRGGYHEGAYDLMLQMDPKDAKKSVVTDYVQLANIADAASIQKKVAQFFGFSLKGFSETPKGVSERVWTDAHYALVDNVTSWNRVWRVVSKDFAKEKEVLVYVPQGHGVTCTWFVKGGLPKEAEKAVIEFCKQIGNVVTVKNRMMVTTGIVEDTQTRLIELDELKSVVDGSVIPARANLYWASLIDIRPGNKIVPAKYMPSLKAVHDVGKGISPNQEKKDQSKKGAPGKKSPDAWVKPASSGFLPAGKKGSVQMTGRVVTVDGKFFIYVEQNSFKYLMRMPQLAAFGEGVLNTNEVNLITPVPTNTKAVKAQPTLPVLKGWKKYLKFQGYA